MNKHEWLQRAEVFDSLRIIPRLFLTSCFVWTIYVTQFLLIWYTHLQASERGPEATGFASVAFVAVFGFLKLVFDRYSQHGRDWNGAPQISTTVVSATQTTGATP